MHKRRALPAAYLIRRIEINDYSSYKGDRMRSTLPMGLQTAQTGTANRMEHVL